MSSLYRSPDIVSAPPRPNTTFFCSIYHRIPSPSDRVTNIIRPKTKNTFGVHDPLGLRYLFQLRVNLSPLRSHKIRHNFADTPSEICECNQGFEDTHHFLFECPRYAIHRATLAVSVIDILQRNNLNHLGNQPKLYLYGHPFLNLIDNRQILLSTIIYIKDTKRFST